MDLPATGFEVWTFAEEFLQGVGVVFSAFIGWHLSTLAASYAMSALRRYVRM